MLGERERFFKNALVICPNLADSSFLHSSCSQPEAHEAETRFVKHSAEHSACSMFFPLD